MKLKPLFLFYFTLLCTSVESYSQIADCIIGPKLCDKSAFTIANLSTAGKDATELNDATCFGPLNGLNAEVNSAWLRWTCDTSGTLTFTITPKHIGNGTANDLGDDIDFALYELPNGIDNCSPKTLMRCEAAGPYIEAGATYQDALRCAGPTGLREGETKISEVPGCYAVDPHSNFLKPLDMVSGHSYALGINNYRAVTNASDTNGVRITFGGTGTFKKLSTSCSTLLNLNETCNNAIQQIKLSPNPVTDIITLSNNATCSAESYIITDVLGRIVMRGKMNPTTNSYTEISVSTLPMGIWFISLEKSNQILGSLKFIVQR